jgi:hypothetical protein
MQLLFSVTLNQTHTMNKTTTLLVLLGFLLVNPSLSMAQGITSFISGEFSNENFNLTYSAGEVVSGSFEGSSMSMTGGTYGVTDLVNTSVDPVGPDFPTEFSLSQNYPNPFNPTTTIVYNLPRSANVTIEIFSSIGALVATYSEGTKPAGSHSVQFNASRFASGLYFYRFIADGALIQTRKMTLIK